jgi:hypothetical protein
MVWVASIPGNYAIQIYSIFWTLSRAMDVWAVTIARLLRVRDESVDPVDHLDLLEPLFL